VLGKIIGDGRLKEDAHLEQVLAQNIRMLLRLCAGLAPAGKQSPFSSSPAETKA